MDKTNKIVAAIGTVCTLIACSCWGWIIGMLTDC